MLQRILNELFTAEVGKGAFLNGTKIQISQTVDLSKAFVALNRGQNAQEKLRYGKICSLLAGEVRTYRCTGSIATDLCYVASGRYDAEIINGCPIHDIAGGALLVKEAGAVILDFEGKESDWEKNVSDEDVNDVIIANKDSATKSQGFLQGV
ncbi:hypothetical protein A2631_01765 [Candidatus Daviesbacteria bacterium RIFCSPHIGHO2_01_FULL_44_29]|uniref:Inositol monophosphatase n=1 Tax=Candidatus Daviesbacteria bacterium RIFCSPHIGHO2_02_FULL_43_12 TaxID=1797776 RepID=A0A1F5KJN9_9BACT|nr:MAG: hypothetical protein A2631_01765 [Candidatus Daviesbacteria bacterium RIFCSPHIGHO2_01_FULL_44_29]OGE39028.1 MAG: hypothetical protein A3E86_00315 [Candidatus Daviesbacteria bacterium RIFCSPHIGHO2_12_FULL_47_45]OGE41128.1 MAG: hypothetical protein A3D25_01160 [Candidatus Daviesbacteria bacterium RIFCSPHIGHO2_02_FULL_43_12]OGE69327.1 MAG: hypothetical protein A3B55_02900 [Candidatus Daviesbacteria bacterium RIFCSPLOWO2_01_FULL_43_15]